MSTHDGQGGSDQAEGTGEVSLKVPVQLLICRFLERGEQPVSGVVDQHIERSELLDGFLHGAFRIGGLGQVKADGIGLSRMGRDEIGDTFRSADGQGDLMAAVQGLRGQGAAETG